MTTLRGGKYRILRPLGHGSFGVTYLATAKFVVKGTLGEMETEVKVAVKEFFMGDINTRAADGSSVEARAEASLPTTARSSDVRQRICLS